MSILITSEFRKIFSQKLVLPAIIVLLVLNIGNTIKICTEYKGVGDDALFYEAGYNFALDYEGEITEEKTAWLLKHTQELSQLSGGEKNGEKLLYWNTVSGEMYLTNELLDAIRKISEYVGYAEQLTERNEALREAASLQENNYLLRVAEKTEKLYSERSIDSFYKTDGINLYTDYDFSSFLVLLLTVLMLCSLFSGEKEAGMNSLLLSSPGGRNKLTGCKLLAAFSAVLAVGVLFCLSDFIAFYALLRFRGFSLPVYALEGLSASPLTISTGAYLLLLVLCRLAAFVLFGAAVAAFSSLINKSSAVFVVSAVCQLVLMLLCAYGGEISDYINLFNPVSMLVARNMFAGLDFINIFSLPLLRYAVTAVCCLAELFILCILCVLVNNKNVKRRARA